MGEPLAQIGRDPDMPAYRTVKDWCDEKHPDGQPTERGLRVSAAIARAREEGFDAIALECLRIADTPVEGVSEKYEAVKVPGDHEDAEPTTEFRIVERKVEDMLGHRKLQIETRLKLLSKWDPARYGDKLQHADANGDVLPPAPQFLFQPVAPLARDDD